MAAKVSQAKGSPAKLRLDVGINLLSPLQGPKTTSERSAAVKMMNADDWCKAERLRYADYISECLGRYSSILTVEKGYSDSKLKKSCRINEVSLPNQSQLDETIHLLTELHGNKFT